MDTQVKKAGNRQDELLKESEACQDIETSAMRQYIVDAALSISDKKLLKLLYIRAKTLKNI